MEIIQIVSFNSSVSALSTDGRVFAFDVDSWKWESLPPIPLIVSEEIVDKKTQITDLGFSHRILNALHKNKIFTVGQLIKLDLTQVGEMPGIGPKSCFELSILLEEIKNSVSVKRKDRICT